jgi:hypothetical protein
MLMMRPRLRRFLLAAVVTVLLTLTFLAYLRSGFIFDLANRLFLCF